MVRVVLCNCSTEEAPALARRLVEDHLAACVNIIPGMTSIYKWEGKLCEEQEAVLLIKTTEERYQEMAEKLTAYHSYDVPEIIALDSAEVSRDYAGWVHDQLR